MLPHVQEPTNLVEKASWGHSSSSLCLACPPRAGGRLPERPLSANRYPLAWPGPAPLPGEDATLQGSLRGGTQGLGGQPAPPSPHVIAQRGTHGHSREGPSPSQAWSPCQELLRGLSIRVPAPCAWPDPSGWARARGPGAQDCHWRCPLTSPSSTRSVRGMGCIQKCPHLGRREGPHGPGNTAWTEHRGCWPEEPSFRCAVSTLTP